MEPLLFYRSILTGRKAIEPGILITWLAQMSFKSKLDRNE